MEPIGVFRGEACRKYAAPRQGVFRGGRGRVELAAGRDFETALRDLDGFERVWLLFVFDRNAGTWRPTARPPLAAPGRDRVGLFATRAPYRPNPIGLSCVRLVAVRGRTLEVDETDLLDGTPILDVKPYVPAADAFPAARAGWVDEQVSDPWQVEVSPAFAAQAAEAARAAAPAVVRAAGAEDLLDTVVLQLSQAPFDASRKRVTATPGGGVLALRMFRIRFTADAAAHVLVLDRLASGYTAADLAAPDDPYADKALHRVLASHPLFPRFTEGS